jgi:hypothetical protein
MYVTTTSTTTLTAQTQPHREELSPPRARRAGPGPPHEFSRLPPRSPPRRGEQGGILVLLFFLFFSLFHILFLVVFFMGALRGLLRRPLSFPILPSIMLTFLHPFSSYNLSPQPLPDGLRAHHRRIFLLQTNLPHTRTCHAPTGDAAPTTALNCTRRRRLPPPVCTWCPPRPPPGCPGRDSTLFGCETGAGMRRSGVLMSADQFTDERRSLPLPP